MQAAAMVHNHQNGPTQFAPHQAELVSETEPPLKKWKCLAAKQRFAANSAVTFRGGPQSELSKYMIEVRNSPAVADAIQFWHLRRPVYPLLSPLAEDLISAPASQAFVERIFSACGLLTAGRRNRMDKSLEMRVFLRLNSPWLLS